jgi:hypothetical protein
VFYEVLVHVFSCFFLLDCFFLLFLGVPIFFFKVVDTSYFCQIFVLLMWWYQCAGVAFRNFFCDLRMEVMNNG